ncbi:unnamed protein product [Closterium sp. NIES-54]
MNQAFLAACRYGGTSPPRATLLFPRGYTFFVRSKNFVWKGPCRGAGLLVRVDARLSVYPRGVLAQNPIFSFQKIKRLVIAGSGVIDGGGQVVWGHGSHRPYLLEAKLCEGVEVSGITLKNPPMVHLSVVYSSNVWIHDFTTDSPYNSPNTDSIHLGVVKNVVVENCTLHGGDDNVSIVGSSSNIVIRDVLCTAGHGISIGSLGKEHELACVSGVTVQDAVLVGLQNGLRIKTYQGGQGTVHGIRYENIRMRDVSIPIVINQFYCERKPCAGHPENLAVFDISYKSISGTTDYSSSGGIQFACSDRVPCGKITMRDVNIKHSRGEVLKGIYQNVFGTSINVSPSPNWQRALSRSSASSIAMEHKKCGGSGLAWASSIGSEDWINRASEIPDAAPALPSSPRADSLLPLSIQPATTTAQHATAIRTWLSRHENLPPSLPSAPSSSPRLKQLMPFPRPANATVLGRFRVALMHGGAAGTRKPTDLTFPLQALSPRSDPQDMQDLVLLASQSTHDYRIQIRDAAATVDASATPEPRHYAGDLGSASASPSGEADAYYGAISDHAKEDIATELTDPESGISQSASSSTLQSPSSPVILTAGEDSNHGEPEPFAVAAQPGQPPSADISSFAENKGSIDRPVEVSPPVSQPMEAATSVRSSRTGATEVIPPYPLASPWLPAQPSLPNPLGSVTASASSEVTLTVASLAAPLSSDPARSISTAGGVSSSPTPSLHNVAFAQPYDPTPKISAQPTPAPLTFVRLPATSAQSTASSSPSSPPPSVGVFDPRAFGAAGNGLKDDTAALNAAFAAACAYRAPTPPNRGRAARPTAPPPSASSGLPLPRQADTTKADPTKSDPRNSGEKAATSGDGATGGRSAASAALAMAVEERGERRVVQQQQSSTRNGGAVASQQTPRQLTTDSAAMPVQGATSGDADGTTPMDAALAPEPATLLLPAGRTFLVASWITWHGPCRGNGLLVQIDGLLQFEPNAAKRSARGAVMVITRVDGLTVAGAGRIDGGGDLLWRRPANSRPHLLLLAEMRRVVVTGITLSNAPMMHLVLRSCAGAVVRGIETRSPGSSPNTDSIHVSACSQVSISNSWLHGGDDDVSIVAGSSNISIDNVTCSAGHGISIGSLGYGGTTACVSNVTVTNSVLSGLSNGLRIKTYQGGSGSVFNIHYENITMLNVDRPIVIDQYYCDAEPCGSGLQALSIFNITYTNITATADATTARGIIRGIDLACSRTVPCTGISLSQVRIAGSTQGGGAAGSRRMQQSSMEPSSLASFDPASQTTVRLSNAFGARDGRAFPLIDRGVAVSLDSAAVDEDATAADALVSAEQRLALTAQRLKCGVQPWVEFGGSL